MSILTLVNHILFCVLLLCVFFFFKQKTAYEMRISDWSSDVCSSDLDAQMIFVDPVAGVADEADTPAFQIFKTAEIIADFAGQGIGVKRVYGEIAPGRILPPIVAERDGSASSISGNIAPQ